jgi:hypothetical protein
VWTEHEDRGYTSRSTKHPNRSIHSSGFAIRGKFKAFDNVGIDIQRLRDFLTRRGYEIVEEKF